MSHGKMVGNRTVLYKVIANFMFSVGALGISSSCRKVIAK